MVGENWRSLLLYLTPPPRNGWPLIFEGLVLTNQRRIFANAIFFEGKVFNCFGLASPPAWSTDFLPINWKVTQGFMKWMVCFRSSPNYFELNIRVLEMYLVFFKFFFLAKYFSKESQCFFFIWRKDCVTKRVSQHYTTWIECKGCVDNPTNCLFLLSFYFPPLFSLCYKLNVTGRGRYSGPEYFRINRNSQSQNNTIDHVQNLDLLKRGHFLETRSRKKNQFKISSWGTLKRAFHLVPIISFFKVIFNF